MPGGADSCVEGRGRGRQADRCGPDDRDGKGGRTGWDCRSGWNGDCVGQQPCRAVGCNHDEESDNQGSMRYCAAVSDIPRDI